MFGASLLSPSPETANDGNPIDKEEDVYKRQAPGRIELTSGTWLSPAHISLAALNRPVWLPLWRLPYLTHATLPLQATPAEQDALRFPLLWTHRNMIRDGKRKTFFSGGLSLVKPKMPQNKVQLLGRGHDQ